MYFCIVFFDLPMSDGVVKSPIYYALYMNLFT